MKEQESLFSDKDVISAYTSKEAIEDGFLFDITTVNPKWKDGLFNYVTNNLLGKGYLTESKINIPNILDLLNQALQIVKKASKDFKEFDSLFSGSIEFPDGKKREIFIQQNETGKFTLMLPEDY